MLVKSLRRIIWRLLTDCWNLNFLQLYVRINIWRHSVRSTQSPEASVDFPPAPKIINDDQELAEEAGEGGRDHYKGPNSEHYTIRKLFSAKEIKGLFCEDECNDE